MDTSQRDPQQTGLVGPRVRVVANAGLLLFLELALIRWSGSLVIHLSYFTNFILLGSFLGIGIGFLRAGATARLFRYSSWGLSAVVLGVTLLQTRIPERGVDLYYFGGTPGGLGAAPWLVLPVIFLIVAGLMTLVAEGLAVSFRALPSLEAYRWDIVGGLCGIAMFSLLSFLGAPPIAWGLVICALIIALTLPSAWLPALGCVPFVIVLAAQSLQASVYFSPYYKIELKPREATGLSSPIIPIWLNSMPYQFVTSSATLRQVFPKYFAPYEDLEVPPERVLIVGSGACLDVGVALDSGAGHVDAVEIDPVLVRIGKAIHPDQPCTDPRVNVFAEDGRTYLERSKQRYDLIVYSLPDSLTLVAGQAGIRLESFLFTREAIQAARDHLQPGGTFALFGFFPATWQTDRMAALMEEVFGQDACLPSGPQADGGAGSKLVLITVGPADCATPWRVADPPLTSPPTDDRPFPYLRGATIPGLYLLALGLILAVSAAAVRAASGPFRQMRGYLDLFFMGAAFLLLETKSVVQFALLFGTTWFVNALVFGGILVVVLAAVEVSRRVGFKRPLRLYPILFATLAIAWLVPPAALLSAPAPVRFVAAVVLAFAPVFVANLIFAQRFRSVEASTVAFGTNLLGAMVGGVIEYTSLLLGYRMLLVLAALLYAAALYTGRSELAVTSDESRGADELTEAAR